MFLLSKGDQEDMVQDALCFRATAFFAVAQLF